MYVIVFNTHTL
jgi:hypothetical protein